LLHLLLQPPYSYSASKRQATLQQLQWVEASLARGAALARLRALLLQQGQLQHWQQQAAAAAAAQGQPGVVLTPEQTYHEAWKQQQQDVAEDTAAAAAAAAAPLCRGRPLLTSFYSRSNKSPWLLKSSPGCVSTTAAAAAAAAAGVGGPEGSAAGEVQQLCVVINGLTQQVRQLKQQLVGGREASLGVLPEVQR
jgi:hypothetical protein